MYAILNYNIKFGFNEMYNIHNYIIILIGVWIDVLWIDNYKYKYGLKSVPYSIPVHG